MNDNKPDFSDFWHTVDELEPPKHKKVWTTTFPFSKIPVIRADSWDGTKWNNHGCRRIYWAFPISRKKDEQ
jgi:hypothetical protein